MLLADGYLRLGENKKVIELVDDSAEDRAKAYVLGSALLRDGQIERGQKIIDRVFRDGSAESLMLIGAAEIAAQENKKALATLERAIAMNPKLPELFSLYGRAKLTDGDPSGAKDAFLKELEHNPSDYESNLQLGALFRIEKDYEKAAHYLRRAGEVRPHSLALKYQLASLELATGDLGKATQMLEEVARAAPDFVEGHITLATAYYRQKRKVDGDRERAIVDRLNAENQARELKK
jgi:tetratricopeptide (TPR) repeat protein